MVGDQDHLLAVPDLCVGPERFLEHADRAGPADVVRHEHVDVHPDVIARFDRLAARLPGEYLFGERLRRHGALLRKTPTVYMSARRQSWTRRASHSRPGI